MNFFEDAFSVLLFSYLGLKENKLGTQYRRIENKRIIREIDTVEQRISRDVDNQTVMKSCLLDEYYLINSHERPPLEKRVTKIQADIDMIADFKMEKALDSSQVSSDAHSIELPPIDRRKKRESAKSRDLDIGATSLGATMSLPVKKTNLGYNAGSPVSLLKKTSTITKTHMSFEEIKKRRLTITSQNLMAKIAEMQKKDKEDSSDDEPISEFKFVPRKNIVVESLNENNCGRQVDAAYVAKLGVEFNLIFSRVQEQIYNLTSTYTKKIDEPKKAKEISAFDPTKTTRRTAKPKNETVSLVKQGSVASPGKQHKDKPLVPEVPKRAKHNERLTPKEIARIRDKLLAQRKVYEQKSVKTEEAAMIEENVKSKIFSESTIREKEYLCLGISVFLK
jgi:hypothetical protein